MTDHDPVFAPKHYLGHPKGVECLDVIEDNPFVPLAWAMKYLWRVSWGGKNDDIEDLNKAIWMIQRELKRREAQALADVITDETATVAVDADDRLWVWQKPHGLWFHPGYSRRTLDELRDDYGPLDLAVDGRER